MRSPKTAVLALCLAALTAVSVPGLALAASANDSFALPVVSGSANIGGWKVVGVEPTTGTVFDLDITAHATWTGSLAAAVGWDTNDVRQGGDLNVSRVSPIQSGHINVLWAITGTVSPLGLGDIDIGTIPFAADNVGCMPLLAGSSYDCTASSSQVSVVNTPGVPNSPYVKFALEATFTITPEGATASRSLSINGVPAVSDADVSLTNAPQLESADIPCSAPVGADVAYSLSDVHYTPDVHVAQGPHIIIGLRDGAFGAIELPALYDAPYGFQVQTDPLFDLTGNGHTTDLGTIQANNIAPAADPGQSMYTGTQGAPITFVGLNSSSACGFPTLRWDFSDGGVAYGGLPQHTFQGSGLYSGLLTATDATGLTSSTAFAIQVANADPIANAGPDTSAAWGKPVQFNGSAVDGADDLATLSYAWSFGDGSPSATGGPSVIHTYATPGVYTATFTVKDKHGAIGSDTRTVTVGQRSTTGSFLGSNGTYDTAGSLSASFADQFGNPVVGRTIQFSVDGNGVGSAQTNASGVAILAWTPAVNAGSHNVSAAFAGDSSYGAATANGSITVDKKATSVVYNGSLSGGPNKSVTLQAVLKDATGKALAGRTITFKLGAQTASAVTDANGVAKTTLQLTQKNGNYSLTATFAPTGLDDLRYTGGAAAATFSLKK